MKKKKLTLKKETIANLSNLEMRILKGGEMGEEIIPLPTRKDTVDPRILCCRVDEEPDPNTPIITGVVCDIYSEKLGTCKLLD